MTPLGSALLVPSKTIRPSMREPIEVCNQWRVEESWWREPIARDYFKVVGARWLALVYFDRVAGSWHLERLYD